MGRLPDSRMKLPSTPEPCFGVIRILNGQTCEQVDTIDDPANRNPVGEIDLDEVHKKLGD